MALLDRARVFGVRARGPSRLVRAGVEPGRRRSKPGDFADRKPAKGGSSPPGDLPETGSTHMFTDTEASLFALRFYRLVSP